MLECAYRYRAWRPVTAQAGRGAGGGARCACSSGGGSMLTISNTVCMRRSYHVKGQRRLSHQFMKG